MRQTRIAIINDYNVAVDDEENITRENDKNININNINSSSFIATGTLIAKTLGILT